MTTRICDPGTPSTPRVKKKATKRITKKATAKPTRKRTVKTLFETTMAEMKKTSSENLVELRDEIARLLDAREFSYKSAHEVAVEELLNLHEFRVDVASLYQDRNKNNQRVGDILEGLAEGGNDGDDGLEVSIPAVHRVWWFMSTPHDSGNGRTTSAEAFLRRYVSVDDSEIVSEGASDMKEAVIKHLLEHNLGQVEACMAHLREARTGTEILQQKYDLSPEEANTFVKGGDLRTRTWIRDEKYHHTNQR